VNGSQTLEDPVKPSPPGWPRISSAVYYEEPGKAIDWICSAYWTDRGYEAEDIEGHHWWFFQRLRSAATK
jgi:hypothetical protein